MGLQLPGLKNLGASSPSALPSPAPLPSPQGRTSLPTRLQTRHSAIEGTGTLKVFVRKATGLRAADLNGKSDPYVILRANDVEKRSKVIPKTLEPEWNEQHSFSGSLPQFLKEGLSIKVYDKDRITFDDFLGEARLSLVELRSKLHHDYELLLSGKKAQGTLYVGVTWLPDTPHDLKSVTTAQRLIDQMARDAARRKAPPPPTAPSVEQVAAAEAAAAEAAVAANDAAKAAEKAALEVAGFVIPPFDDFPNTRTFVLGPLVVLWAPLAACLLGLCFTAFAINETPAALFAALYATWNAARFGLLARLVATVAAFAAAAIAVPLSALVGLIIGLFYGGHVGALFLTGFGTSDFITTPVAWLRHTVYGGVRLRGQRMLEQDARLPEAYVALDTLVLAPIAACSLGLVAAPIVSLRLVAGACIEVSPSVGASINALVNTRRLGVLGRIISFPFAFLLPLLLVIISPFWGLLSGFVHGFVNGWLAVTRKQPIDFWTMPVAQLAAAFNALSRRADGILDEDGLLGDSYVPCEFYVLAPFGALVGAMIACPLLAVQLVAISLCPRALSNALKIATESNRIGMFAKGCLQFFLVVFTLVLLPPLALVCGLFMGLYYGAVTGWRFFTQNGSIDCFLDPKQLWQDAVLEKLGIATDELAAYERSAVVPDVVIDVNPLLLATACAMGVLGAAVTAIVYTLIGLFWMPKMIFEMYRALNNICASDFKIVEALFALAAYLLQIPLIPLYAVLFTAWLPIEGFAVGFARVAYFVIYHSNVGYIKGSCGCILNTLGFTGLIPAAAQLRTDILARWNARDKPVTRTYERLADWQENMLHWWSTTVVRTRNDSLESERSYAAWRTRSRSNPRQPYVALGDLEGGEGLSPRTAAGGSQQPFVRSAGGGTQRAPDLSPPQRAHAPPGEELGVAE